MKKTLPVALATVALSVSLVGCGSSQPSSSGSTSTLSGTVTASGSSALLPLAKQAAEAFMEKNPDVVVTVNGGGSGEGLKQVSAGSVDVGNSDVSAETKLDAAAAAELTDHKVAVVTMTPVVNASLPVKDLTKEQVKAIFTGQTTNWKDVGGPDLPILLVTRPSSSGTRAVFKNYALDGAEEASNKSLETDDSGTLLQTIEQNPGAIGYVALPYLTNNSKVAAVAIEGVKASLETTYNGTYPVWDFEHMYTKGEVSAQAQAFIDYMTGDEFAVEIEKLGYGVSSKLSEQALSNHK